VTRADAQLPFIPKEIVQASKQECLWLVIDNIVYDCSGFEHPGGATVIQSFRGEDCSWQFWRFHSKTHMQEFGRPLRIGRTAGVPNRFKERPKFVGLSKLGGNDW
jgi:cytochrome b involved in lipid metabolism